MKSPGGTGRGPPAKRHIRSWIVTGVTQRVLGRWSANDLAERDRERDEDGDRRQHEGDLAPVWARSGAVAVWSAGPRSSRTARSSVLTGSIEFAHEARITPPGCRTVTRVESNKSCSRPSRDRRHPSSASAAISSPWRRTSVADSRRSRRPPGGAGSRTLVTGSDRRLAVRRGLPVRYR